MKKQFARGLDSFCRRDWWWEVFFFAIFVIFVSAKAVVADKTTELCAVPDVRRNIFVITGLFMDGPAPAYRKVLLWTGIFQVNALEFYMR